MIVNLILIFAVEYGAFLKDVLFLVAVVIEVVNALVNSNIHLFNQNAISWHSVALININDVSND